MIETFDCWRDDPNWNDSITEMAMLNEAYAWKQMVLSDDLVQMFSMAFLMDSVSLKEEKMILRIWRTLKRTWLNVQSPQLEVEGAAALKEDQGRLHPH